MIRGLQFGVFLAVSALEIMEGSARHLANRAFIGKTTLMSGMEGVLGEEVEILPVTVEYLVNSTARGECVSNEADDKANAYWKANLRLMGTLLLIWFAVSFGAGVLFVDPLNAIQLGGFKLGFWFAQQGSMLTFVVLIFVYVVRMNRIDRAHGVDEE